MARGSSVGSSLRCRQRFAPGIQCRTRADRQFRKERFGPDGTVGSERINCTSYDDAVYAGDVPADDYHFDVSEYTCSVAACFYPYLTGDYTEHW